ncbi:hypothetical protein CNECB9_5260040 [Cupriavidus necator]|uniref:Uncharacterized protein n=1 Tax=Cupriavidus necator TaxID=106590 RepID=A0A1K0IPL7_CUPNE|nr:hypothetical protein CNECB9_5260040 [Cupriavidus necator]
MWCMRLLLRRNITRRCEVSVCGWCGHRCRSRGIDHLVFGLALLWRWLLRARWLNSSNQQQKKNSATKKTDCDSAQVAHDPAMAFPFEVPRRVPPKPAPCRQRRQNDHYTLHTLSQIAASLTSNSNPAA